MNGIRLRHIVSKLLTLQVEMSESMCYASTSVLTDLRLNIISVINLEKLESIVFILSREEGGGWLAATLSSKEVDSRNSSEGSGEG